MDLASVMKFLEEEMLLPVQDLKVNPLSGLKSNSSLMQPDLDYLLEASDDDLGITPVDGDVSSSNVVPAIGIPPPDGDALLLINHFKESLASLPCDAARPKALIYILVQ